MNKTDEITSDADILDSRDIQDRFDYLTEEIENAFSDAGRENFDFQNAFEKDQKKTLAIINRLVDRNFLDNGIFEEWSSLKETFIDDNSIYGWEHGVIFLRDSYMNEAWAEQELKDLGYLSNDIPYVISNNIDWEGVLQDLQEDYSEIEFDGVTYYYRD